MFRSRSRSGARTAAPAASKSNQFETLEPRRLMSVTGLPNYASFVHSAGMVFNGYGTAATVSKHSLQLTDGLTYEARSAWYAARVSVDSFTSTFSFISTKSNISADGLTFTIQNNGATALGTTGHDLGYTGITRSVGISFNLYNYKNFGSRFSFDTSGMQPSSNVLMGNVDLHNGDLFTCTLNYNGSVLTAKVVDDANPSDVFTDSEKVNIVKSIGAHSAYVGFTGATGDHVSTQKITSWSYSQGPKVSSVTASPAKVTKHVSELTANVTDPLGTTGLTYTWSLISAPANARAATFSTNGTTADDTAVSGFQRRHLRLPGFGEGQRWVYRHGRCGYRQGLICP